MRVDELSYNNGAFEKEEKAENMAEKTAKPEETETFEETTEEITEEYSEENYVANKEARKQKRNTKIKRRHTFIKVMLALLCVVGVLMTPVFNIKSVTVSGNTFLTDEQVIQASGISKNSNIFIFQTKKAVNGLENLSFVDVAKVKRTFPSGVNIYIKECTPIAQIACGHSLYLVVDKNAKILDAVSNVKKYDVPCISDVAVSEFEVGNKIKVEDQKAFDRLLLLSSEISENDMAGDVENIYAKNASLYIKMKRDITCNLGQGENLSYRVKFVKEVYKSIPEEKTGKLEFVEEYKAVFTEDEK